MKLNFTLFIFLLTSVGAHAQSIAGNYPEPGSHSRSSLSKVNLNGQWRGTFREGSPISAASLLGDAATTYVLELNVRGSTVSGYSYTYFTDLGPKRYYTICRITGTADKTTNSIIVTEVERIKFNTPPNITNCFQVHKLHFEKGPGNTEYLKGTWYPAPNQQCTSSGETVLSRETRERTPFAVKLPPKKDEVAKATPRAVPKQQPATKRQATPKPAPTQAKPETKAVTSEIAVDKPGTELPVHGKSMKLDMPPAPIYRGYEKRKSEVVRSINITNPVFQVEFYDNGEIDGDSISVFFNGKLVISHQMLTAQPLTLTLSIDEKYKNNVITMYAENLGSIPPNTAVMIVRDGNKRYEVRMESDLGKSGSVIFRHGDD